MQRSNAAFREPCNGRCMYSTACVAQDCVYSVRKASGSAELRAAAFLRALSFYSYPTDRSLWAQQVWSCFRGCYLG